MDRGPAYPAALAPAQTLSPRKFARFALSKPVVAGVANVTAATQGALVTGDTIREFLKANGVDRAGGSTDAKASVCA